MVIKNMKLVIYRPYALMMSLALFLVYAMAAFTKASDCTLSAFTTFPFTG